jgi:hypothetical protein
MKCNERDKENCSVQMNLWAKQTTRFNSANYMIMVFLADNSLCIWNDSSDTGLIRLIFLYIAYQRQMRDLLSMEKLATT